MNFRWGLFIFIKRRALKMVLKLYNFYKNVQKQVRPPGTPPLCSPLLPEEIYGVKCVCVFAEFKRQPGVDCISFPFQID